MKITFIGDISLNDDYIDLYKENANPFTNLKPFLSSKNYNVGNLECMAKGEKGENILKKPRLTTTLSTLNYLKELNLNLVTLAQNHVYDHLEDGYDKTINFLEENKINYMGSGKSPEAAKQIKIIEREGIKIGILNYITSDTNPDLPIDSKVFLNTFHQETCIDDLVSIKEDVDFRIVILHWGGRVEGGLYPDFNQPSLAKKIIDSGADLVIGHHSHTIQPYEIYKGKYIFYSLGNFCFSDYTFNGEFNPMPKRRNITLILDVNFSKKNYTIHLNFFKNNKTSFSPLIYERKLKYRNLIFKIVSKFKPIWYVYFFNLKFILPFIHFSQRKDLSVKSKIKRLFKAIKKRIV